MDVHGNYLVTLLRFKIFLNKKSREKIPTQAISHKWKDSHSFEEELLFKSLYKVFVNIIVFIMINPDLVLQSSQIHPSPLPLLAHCTPKSFSRLQQPLARPQLWVTPFVHSSLSSQNNLPKEQNCHCRLKAFNVFPVPLSWFSGPSDPRLPLTPPHTHTSQQHLFQPS